MAKSKTKYPATNEEILKVCNTAGFEEVTGIEPLGAGEFNAVYRFNGKLGEESGIFVLKIAPPKDANVLTYERGMMESEVFWYEQMEKHTDVGIPKVYFHDFRDTDIGTHCFIMEYLEGEPLWTIGSDREAYEKAQIEKIRMLTKIHRIHGTQYGYLQTGLHDTWYEAIRSMTQQLITDCEHLGYETPDGRKLLETIDQYKELLESVPCRMVNFDLWDSNVLSGKDGKLYWIDPERSFWGDPIADFITLGRGQTIPLYEKKEAIEVYNRTAEIPVECSREENIRYAIAVAYLALIEEVEKYVRYEPDEPNYIRNTTDARKMYDMAWEICFD